MAYKISSKLAIAANAIAVTLAQGLTADEENILGNLFALAGASLLSMAAIDSAIQSNLTDSTQPPKITVG